MSGVKRSWKRVDGVLLLDKPLGMSSNAALQSARRLFSAAKAGHTGTLDPLASGLLPLCFGEATKFSADLLEADKVYEADLLFGVTTETGDAEGAVLQRREVAFARADLESALVRFRGRITQIPPMYSALKVDGQPMYKLARQGVAVERKAREVTIHALELLDFGGERCRLRVSCSKGTYIRTLAEDIGEHLGCGAHLTALRRTAVGALSLAGAFTLDHLAALDEEARLACLQPPDALLQTLPVVHLSADERRRFTNGNPVAVPQSTLVVATKCRVYADGNLLGVGEIAAGPIVCPRRLVCA